MYYHQQDKMSSKKLNNNNNCLYCWHRQTKNGMYFLKEHQAKIRIAGFGHEIQYLLFTQQLYVFPSRPSGGKYNTDIESVGGKN
jgi:hypothetical protein